MVKKIVKYNLRFYSKFLLLIGALIAFICSFGVSTYAWSLDSNGNLKSDNLLKIDNVSKNAYNVTITVENGIFTLNGTASGSGPLFFDCVIPSGTYTLSVFNTFVSTDINFYCSIRYNTSSQISNSVIYCDNVNDYSTFTSNNVAYVFVVRVASGVTYDNVVLKPMLVSGSSVPSSYEPYGVTYYSDSTMKKMVQSSFGAFAYASEIRLYYNNGTVSQLYKTYSSCYDLALEDWCRFINGSLNIDDYGFIFSTLGGDSDWSYNIGVDFPSSAIKVSNFKDWYFYGYSKFEFITYSNTYVLNGSYEVMNPYVIDLTSNSINNLNGSDYIKTINYYRKSPNIGIAYGQFGTPNNSIYYNEGYNDGIDKGYDNGFDSGFTDGKNEGYTMGYNEGYRDGSNDNFTTNGFKTLIGSIFNYPINFVKNVFNFEFMGINISSLIFFILSIGIVIFVLNRFKK